MKCCFYGRSIHSMGFDMRIIKTNKKTLESILRKWYQKGINNLPYEALEELENNVSTKIFESRLNLFSDFEENGYLPYANDTYAQLSPQLVTALIKWINEVCKTPWSDDNRYGTEYKRLKKYFEDLNANSEEDIIFYKYDC